MSSLPGLTLEAFLMWDFDLIVDGDRSANASLQIAEMLGVKTRRKSITKEQFESIIKLFEPHRSYVETKLFYFDENEQSWRDYASYSFGDIPKDLSVKALALIESFAR